MFAGRYGGCKEDEDEQSSLPGAGWNPAIYCQTQFGGCYRSTLDESPTIPALGSETLRQIVKVADCPLRVFPVAKFRLPGEVCAIALMTRHKYIHVGFAATSCRRESTCNHTESIVSSIYSLLITAVKSKISLNLVLFR